MEKQRSLPGVEWETARCGLCDGAESREVLVAEDLLFGLPGRFRLVRCNDCGHYFLNPRPTRETIGRFYPDDYGPHRDHHTAGVSESRDQASQPAIETATESASSEPASGRPWYLSSVVRRVPGLRRLYYWLSADQSEIVPTPSCERPRGLEVGCGSGRFLERLQECGWDAEGIEPAEVPASRCRERGLRVHVGGFESLKSAGDRFDAIFAWMVIEHLHDPAAALREMRRLLKADGQLLFSVPNYGCWESRVFGRYSYSLQLPIHLHQFTPQTIHRLLRENGFRVERLIHQPNLLNVVGSMGLWFQHRPPFDRLGAQLVQFTNAPSMWATLAMAPVAKFLAAIRQGGRLTIIARRDDTLGNRHDGVTVKPLSGQTDG